MKKRQIYTGVVERVDFPNKAVVKAQVPQPDESVATEYAVVKGALPGQTVEFSVKKARKNKCEGRLRSVLKKKRTVRNARGEVSKFWYMRWL